MKYKTNSSNNTINYFSHFLRYITAGIVIIIMTVSSALYYTFKSIKLSDIYNASKNDLSYAAYSSNFMVDSAKSLIAQISADIDISNLRYRTAIEPQDTLSSLEHLKNYSTSMPFVDSIYIYNSNTDTFYTTLSGGIQKSSSFYDKDIINILNNPDDINISKPIARRIPLDSIPGGYGQYSYVFTFIYCEKDINNKADSAIILNVSEMWVRKVISSLNSENGNDIFIVDGNGRIISSIYNDKMLSYITKTSYFDHIKSLKESSGYFTDNIDGIKSLVTFASTDNLDWKFVQTQPYTIVMGKLDQVRNNTIVICLTIVIVGLILSYILSKHIYKSVDDVIVKLRSMLEDKVKTSRLTKQNVLKTLMLNDGPIEIDAIKEDFENHEIKLYPDKTMTLIILRIDSYSEFCFKYNYEDRNLFKQEIMNIANRVLSVNYNVESADMESDHVVLLLNPLNSITDNNEKSLQVSLKEIQSIIQKELLISISITVSLKGYTLKDINFLYNETLNASYYRTFYGYKSIILADNLEIDNDYTYPVHVEKSLIDALLSNKIDDVKELFQQIVNEQLASYPYSSFDSMLLRLAFSINSAIETIEKTNHIQVYHNHNTFISGLNKLETLNGIKEYFFKMFDELAARMKQKKNSKHEELINSIIDMINTNYTDTCLCLDSIADSVNMSPVYLGRLFKKSTLKSVADYINDIRMEKAEHLLLTTNDPINDIVEKVGFSNRSYFHTMFKKKYGVTPSEYRNDDKKINLEE